MHRPHTDATFIECNHLITNLIQCHYNAQPTTGLYGAASVEEYRAQYMVKEGANLRQAAALMLAAIDDIQQHPSIADDTVTMARTGKHLASCTVNSFSGAHQ